MESTPQALKRKPLSRPSGSSRALPFSSTKIRFFGSFQDLRFAGGIKESRWVNYFCSISRPLRKESSFLSPEGRMTVVCSTSRPFN